MEISSISGSDVIPSGFSTEAPQREEAVERRETTETVVRESVDGRTGNNIDTYA